MKLYVVIGSSILNMYDVVFDNFIGVFSSKEKAVKAKQDWYKKYRENEKDYPIEIEQIEVDEIQD